MESKASYVIVEYDPAGSGAGRMTRANVTITRAGVVTIPVTDGMENRDEITVTFVNVRVRDLMVGDALPAEDMVVVTDDGIAQDPEDDFGNTTRIYVTLQDQSAIRFTPTRKKENSITDVTVYYTVKDTIADADDGIDTITVALPGGWEAAYANDGDPANDSRFWHFLLMIDGGIDLGATPDAVREVTSLPAGTATAMKSKASYVIVEYDPTGSGAGRMTAAAVEIDNSR